MIKPENQTNELLRYQLALKETELAKLREEMEAQDAEEAEYCEKMVGEVQARDATIAKLREEVERLKAAGEVLAMEAQSYITIGFDHHNESAALQIAIDDFRQLSPPSEAGQQQAEKETQT